MGPLPGPGEITCVACRLSKVKCDKADPCGRCVRLKLGCVMEARPKGRPPMRREDGSPASTPAGSRSASPQKAKPEPPPEPVIPFSFLTGRTTRLSVAVESGAAEQDVQAVVEEETVKAFPRAPVPKPTAPRPKKKKEGKGKPPLPPQSATAKAQKRKAEQAAEAHAKWKKKFKKTPRVKKEALAPTSQAGKGAERVEVHSGVQSSLALALALAEEPPLKPPHAGAGAAEPRGKKKTAMALVRRPKRKVQAKPKAPAMPPPPLPTRDPRSPRVILQPKSPRVEGGQLLADDMLGWEHAPGLEDEEDDEEEEEGLGVCADEEEDTDWGASGALGRAMLGQFTKLRRSHSELQHTKALAILRAWGLATRKQGSAPALRPYVSAIARAMDVDLRTLLKDPYLISQIREFGVPATPQQKQSFDPSSTDHYLQELFFGGGAAIMVVFIQGQRRVSVNRQFSEEYLPSARDSKGANSVQVLERAIGPEDRENFGQRVMHMLFVSPDAACEVDDIIKCCSKTDNCDRLCLARVRALVSDAGSYFAMVLSLQALPSSSKYLAASMASYSSFQSDELSRLPYHSSLSSSQMTDMSDVGDELDRSAMPPPPGRPTQSTSYMSTTSSALDEIPPWKPVELRRDESLDFIEGIQALLQLGGIPD